jgi:RimJ/RimL family protein N-acetyltransferase
MITFKALSLEDCELVRQWRNEDISSFRTCHQLTKDEQQQFYFDIVSNPKSNCRYWGVWSGTTLIGMAGLVNISWENSHAEISLIVRPTSRQQGYGDKIVTELLVEGFNKLNLQNIYGECYANSPHMPFWNAMIRKHGAYDTTLPQRKFWDGQYFDSVYFNFKRPY